MGKKIIEMQKMVKPNGIYELEDAIKLAKKTSYSKFVGSLDIAIKLNLDVRKADQQLRGSILLPHGNGKTVKVLAAIDTIKLVEECKAAKGRHNCKYWRLNINTTKR